MGDFILTNFAGFQDLSIADFYCLAPTAPIEDVLYYPTTLAASDAGSWFYLPRSCLFVKGKGISSLKIPLVEGV